MTPIRHIYTLSDPRTDEVRYVGMTASPSRRRYQHCNPDVDRKTHVANWVRSLVAEGFMPTMTVIEEVTVDNWQEAEQPWIKHFKDLGCDLCNATAGGDGVGEYDPRTMSKDSWDRMVKAASSPKPKGTLHPLSKKLKGKRPEAAIAAKKALYAAGKVRLSEEQKRKLAEANRNKPRVCCLHCGREMTGDKVKQHLHFAATADTRGRSVFAGRPRKVEA